MIHAFQRLELAFWTLLPSLITLLLLITCLVPKHLGGLESFMPLLPLMPIFYWGLAHAREMPYWFVFLVGLVTDSIQGTPLGLSSLLYIFFLGLLHAQRKFILKEGFAVKWLYFAVLLAVVESLSWLLVSFVNASPQAFQPGAIQWLLTVGCYPALHTVFDLIYERVNIRRWRILHSH